MGQGSPHFEYGFASQLELCPIGMESFILECVFIQKLVFLHICGSRPIVMVLVTTLHSLIVTVTWSLHILYLHEYLGTTYYALYVELCTLYVSLRT
jgi:hypothetical protein